MTSPSQCGVPVNLGREVIPDAEAELGLAVLNAETPAGSVLHPDPAEPRHIPTAYLPVEDPANGESCQECGEWWPCPEAWQVVEPRPVVCARIKASVAVHDAVCPGVQEGQR